MTSRAAKSRSGPAKATPPNTAPLSDPRIRPTAVLRSSTACLFESTAALSHRSTMNGRMTSRYLPRTYT